jgi:hypothetical protein
MGMIEGFLHWSGVKLLSLVEARSDLNIQEPACIGTLSTQEKS